MTENGTEQPPEGAVPQQGIPITMQVIRHPQLITAERAENGVVLVNFVVIEGGQAVQHTYPVGESGKQAILDALTGGLALP